MTSDSDHLPDRIDYEENPIPVQISSNSALHSF